MAFTLPAAEVAKRLTVANVGVGEAGGPVTINVYPNPATGRLAVCTAAPVQSIRLVNMLGQTVLAHGPANGTTTLAVGHLERGAYFLRIIGNDDVTTRKVILK